MIDYIIIGGQLYHAKSDERKNHKYVARVLTKKTKGKNVYRYFYTLDEWKAYKQSKDKTDVNNTGSTTEQLYRKNLQNQNVNKKQHVETSEERYRKIQQADYYRKNHIETSEEKYRRLQQENYKKKQHVETSEEKHRRLQQDKYDEEHLSTKLPNGKLKQFESKDEYHDYKERLEYQKNEPSFMKSVPDIPENKVYTKMEDENEINETYNRFDDKRSMNCANCSMAYELRRRGYDVQAKEFPSDFYETREGYESFPYRLHKYFENPTTLYIDSNGDTYEMDKDVAKEIDDTDGHMPENAPYIDRHAYLGYESYTTESLEKAIKSTNPEGSRGMIDVYWNKGGGHSLIYEVNTDGTVVIRDSQTYDEYGLDELAPLVRSVMTTRTDNLNLREDCLLAVEPNTRGKRTQYLDRYEWHFIL